MKVNACCTALGQKALACCDALVYCGGESVAAAEVYVPFSQSATGNIYVPSLDGDDIPELVSDYLFCKNARAYVCAADDLEETGRIEARYKLSPVMLLHRLGVLDRCTVVGGSCLDNDDLDLMAQEGVALVITPTASAGYGRGFAPVCAALRRGVRVGVGTLDCKYNRAADIAKELEFLSLTANAEMKRENALSKEQIQKISSFII